LGFGVGGFGVGVWGQIPNPQSPIPIPNPHLNIFTKLCTLFIKILYFKRLKIKKRIKLLWEFAMKKKKKGKQNQFM
jgi:hypothetical protein